MSEPFGKSAIAFRTVRPAEIERIGEVNRRAINREELIDGEYVAQEVQMT